MVVPNETFITTAFAPSDQVIVELFACASPFTLISTIAPALIASATMVFVAFAVSAVYVLTFPLNVGVNTNAPIVSLDKCASKGLLNQERKLHLRK